MRRTLIQLARFFLKQLFRGSKHFCPCCGSSLSRFLKVKVESSFNISCPSCGSLERHRLLGAWMSKGSIKSLGKVLHVAPEKCLERLVKRTGTHAYVSIDFKQGVAEHTGDLRNLSFLDAEFDAVICFHVLEHIPEDLLAMKEILRVLSAQGVAFISVPIVGTHSEEASPEMSEAERIRRFGQADHVRNYGTDIHDRLLAVGLNAKLLRAHDFLSAAEVDQFGLNQSEILIVANKA